jgi:FAS-associated factor 2
MEALSDRQREVLLTFQEISQIEDIELSIQILEENDWNIDAAVDNFMMFGQRSSSSNFSSTSSAISRPSTAPLVQRNNHISPSNNRRNNDTVANDTEANQNDTNYPLLNLIINPLKWLFQTRPVSISPDNDTRKFIDEFDLTYSNQHPTFHDRSYQSAVAAAFESSKFLLVYLHSPMHQDTSKFCQQTLCTQSFSSFVNERMVTWAGKVWDPQAYDLSSQLRASAFPFLAILVCQSDRVVQVLSRFQGHMEEAELTEKLRNVMTANTAVVTRIQAEADRRREFSMLREQQDREYREAEESDRRERERRENEERERIRLEEEERQRQELEAAMELSRRLNYEGDIGKRRAELSPEPPASDVDVAVIRFQLPQGTKLSRRFPKLETVQVS